MRTHSKRSMAAVVAAAAMAGCALLVGCGGGGSHSPVAGTSSVRVFAPGGSPYGKTYAEWGAAWWQYVMGSAAADDPVQDMTGEKGQIGQTGPVWFLVGSYGGPATRSLTVPADTALFLPLINTLVGGDPTNDPTFEAGGRTLARNFVDGVAELNATVDGNPVANLWDYRVQSPYFPITWHATDPIYPGVPPFFRFLTEGYWVILEPLPAGPHTLKFGGKHVEAGAAPGDLVVFEVDITYLLRVQ